MYRAGSVVICFLLAISTAAAQGIDLRPEISNVSVRINQTVDPADVIEGCAKSSSGRTLIIFDHTAWNEGVSDLHLGDPLCPNCDQVGVPVCGNPLFECSAAGGHNHAHLRNFSSYTVYREHSNSPLVRGHKEGFCLQNTFCKDGVPQPSPSSECNFLKAGCADVYSGGLGCQYVDITDLPPGKYRLKVEINPLRSLTETSYSNNIIEQPFEICELGRTLTFITTLGSERDNFKRKFELRAKVGAPVKSFNPLKDGMRLQLQIDSRPAFTGFGAVLPGGARGTGCYPRDGWTHRGDTWYYYNVTGSDKDCSQPVTAGIKTAKVRHRGKFLDVKLTGTTDLYAVPKSPKFGLLLNDYSPLNGPNETCGSAVFRHCVRQANGGVVCQ